MLQLKIVSTPVKLDPDDFPRVLISLGESGESIPALHRSRAMILELAGLDPQDVPVPAVTHSPPRVGRGDVCFRGEETFYLLGGDEPPRLEVGLITRDIVAAGERLRSFATAVESAILRSIDGRKTRHMKFEWSSSSPSSERLKKIVSPNPEDAELQFEQARLDPAEVAGSQVLAGSTVRALLVEIGQAGFAREQNILARRGKAKEDVIQALTALKETGLTDVEYLLECKKTRNALTRLRTAADLQANAVAQLRCPACSAFFRDESLSEGYSRSELGRRLSEKSYWMTVWVTERLLHAGISLESVIWNLTQSGEEVDILADVLGGLWIFELKDREFGSGDARPLNYRQVRYSAEKAVIVTTERVSPDAKRVFDELAKESSRNRGRPVLVEGLNRLDEVLLEQIDAAYLRQINRKIMAVGGVHGANLRQVIAKKYGFPASAESDTSDERWSFFTGLEPFWSTRGG